MTVGDKVWLEMLYADEEYIHDTHRCGTVNKVIRENEPQLG
jgi:hypothetical protein